MSVIVYTTKQCKKCQELKAFLEKSHIKYEEKDLSDPEVLTELRFNGVFSLSAPVLQIRDAFFTTTQLFQKNGKIRKGVVKRAIEKLL